MAAPAALVWEVLADWKDYPAWNPYVLCLTGEQQVGETLQLSVATAQQPMQLSPRLVEWEDGHGFAWRGRALFYGLFETDHYFAVTPLAPERTRVEQWEDFRGVLAYFLRNNTAMQAELQQRFQQMHQALEEEVHRRISTGKPDR
jgi:hypothetical protein